MHKSSRRAGFTLVELIIYIGIFSIVSVFLTGTLITTVSIQNREGASNEVSGQLNLVLQTVQRLVRESSLIEDVFEGTAPVYDLDGVLQNPCVSSYCGVQLRMEDSALDPTIVSSDSTGVYVRQGSGDLESLTNSKVTVDSLVFVKNEIPNATATLSIEATLSYNTADPQFASTRSLKSAIGRVNAAVFDSDLTPNADGQFDIGGTNSWGNAFFDGNVTAGGGGNTVYRCATAGALPIGALTINTGSCGTTADTGLRIK